MIEITPLVKLEQHEVQLEFVRASGPGGQNVNKVATSVQLRFDVRNSPSLQEDVKERLIQLGGSRITDDGVLIIEARRFRTQEQNRLDALRRLTLLIQKALQKPKTRRATRPSPAAKALRIDEKKKRGQIKRTRRVTPHDWE
jgi:ribosome-associated protein